MSLVLGIDPGAIAGLAVVDTARHRLLYGMTVRTKAHVTAPEKGHIVAQAALRLLQQFPLCLCVGLEAQFAPHLRNVAGRDLKRAEATAGAAAKVSFISGCISGAIMTMYPWISVVQVQPATAAASIGLKGPRSKDAVRAQMKLVLRIKEPLPEEQADAAACAYGYRRASARETSCVGG